MGCPSIRYRWSSLDSLSKAIFFLSLLGLATSVVLVVGAVWLKVKVGDHLDLAIPQEGYLWPATLGLAVLLVTPSHLLGISVRTSLAKSFTSPKLLRRSGKCLNRLLIIHALLSFASGVLVFGVCAGGAYLWGISRRRVKQGLYLAVRRYPVETETKLRLDCLQIDLGCCGSETYADWFFVPWMESARVETKSLVSDDVSNEDDVDPAIRSRRSKNVGQYFSADVPYSCCNTSTLEKCTHHDIISKDSYKPEALSSISTEGCHTRLVERANQAGAGLVACLLFISVYQIFVSIMVRLMQTARLCAFRANGKGEFFVGWIFGSAPKNLTSKDNDLEIRNLKEETACEEETSGTEKSSSPPSPPPPPRQSGGADKPKKACLRMREYYREKRKRAAKERDVDDDDEDEDDDIALRILNSTGVFGRCRRLLGDQDRNDECGKVIDKRSRARRRGRRRHTHAGETSPSSSSSMASAATPKREPSRGRKSESCPLHNPDGTRKSKSGSSACCPIHGHKNPLYR